MNEKANGCVLSICIPTRNRSDRLARCVETLTNLRIFRESSEIELVISDNASTDDTGEVCSRFSARWPNRIKYFRNQGNEGDMNFYLAMARGAGEFLKLSNDTLLFSDDGLSAILHAVKENINERPLLFFTNGNGTSREMCKKCKTMDEFLLEASFYSTWIGSVGFWKDQLLRLPDFARKRASQLTQVDAIFRTLAYHPYSVVYNCVFADVMSVKNKGGYSLSLVFGRNYFSILKEYVVKGLLSRETYRRERRVMLRRHLLPYFIKTNSEFLGFGYVRNLFVYYAFDPIYYLAMPFVYVQTFYKLARKLVAKGLL